MTDIDVSSCTVKWGPPECDGGSPILGYNVQYCSASEQHWIKANRELLQSTAFTVTGLAEGTEYKLCVSAVNKAGETNSTQTFITAGSSQHTVK